MTPRSFPNPGRDPVFTRFVSGLYQGLTKAKSCKIMFSWTEVKIFDEGGYDITAPQNARYIS